MLDLWEPTEDEQVTVDPRTRSRTIHTGLKYPDGSQGFIIIGRIGNTMWEPCKVVKKVIVEYYEEPEVSTPANGDSVQDGGDKGGQPTDGIQADGIGQGSGVSSGKRSKRSKKGGQNSGANVGA